MTFRCRPADGNFGLIVEEFEPDLSDQQLRALLLSLFKHRFLVLKTQGLDNDQYVAFAKRIAEPIKLSSDACYPEIASITNQNEDTSQSKRGAAHWHTDQSFRKTLSSVTMLYSVKAPKTGGQTQFVNMAAAYAGLTVNQKSMIRSLKVSHRHGVAISARPGDHVPIPPPNWPKTYTVTHPLVREHPVTKQSTLYAITGTAQGIEGYSTTDAKRLLDELCDHTFQSKFLNAYQHCVDDILMWDNPTTMHSASPITQASDDDDTRLLRRISLKGYAPLFPEAPFQ